MRRLTPRECERLQGLPDDWTRHGASGKEISDSRRYQMIGNAGAVGELTIAVDRAATRYSVRLPYGATLGHEARYDQLTDPIQFTQGRVYVARGAEIEDASKGE